MSTMLDPTLALALRRGARSGSLITQSHIAVRLHLPSAVSYLPSGLAFITVMPPWHDLLKARPVV